MAITLPTLEYEQKLWESGVQHVVGIDEVGRGALAGPVVTAAVVFDSLHVPIVGIRDSKTLSKLQKNHLEKIIQDNCSFYAIGEASPSEIDSIGIVAATALAMERALQKIAIVEHVLIDGLPFKEKQLLAKYKKSFIVKGDSKSYSIAAASILAKVYRDKYMEQLAQDHPSYAWQKNVGYGTRQHIASINEHGTTTHHRLSFLK